MTDTPTLTGQDIGQAENAVRAVFDALLAETGTTFHQWGGVCRRPPPADPSWSRIGWCAR
jgi:hypothetical protein